jgi:hypothetical protein
VCGSGSLPDCVVRVSCSDVQPDGMLGVVRSHDANHEGGKESHDLVDWNDFGLVHGEAAALQVHNTLTCGLQVAQPTRMCADMGG